MTTSTARSDAYLSSDQERDRLATLHSTYILDADLDEAFEAHVEMARLITGASTSVVSLVGESNQHFKASSGTTLSGTPRDISFCNHAVGTDDVLEVCNAAEDPTFRHNPLVTGFPNIRYYFGVPIRGFNGLPIGTLCVFDDKPRLPLRDTERTALEKLALSVESIIEHQRVMRVRDAQLSIAKSDQDAEDAHNYRGAIERARLEFETIREALASKPDSRERIEKAVQNGLDALSSRKAAEPDQLWSTMTGTLLDSLEDYAAREDVTLDWQEQALGARTPPASAEHMLRALVRAAIDHSAARTRVGVRFKSSPHFTSVSIYREDSGLKVVKPIDNELPDKSKLDRVMSKARESVMASGGYLEEKPWTGGTVIKAWYPHGSSVT